MKKPILILLFIFFLVNNCFATDIIKVKNEQFYKTTLGIENDEVIIGDKNSDTFKPKITLSKWNKEDMLIINPVGISADNPVINIDKSLEIGDNKIGFYYALDKDNPDNFKFGLILKEKPATNTWNFQLENWEEFNFFYQPPLTEEWKVGDMGGKVFRITETQCLDKDNNVIISRPENIVGGYVIYHKWKANHEIGKINYATGKFGEISRPKFIDANNNWVWGDLQIKNGIYTITVPQSFLDTATYPIKANDQFGLNTKGATTYGDGVVANEFWGTRFANAPAGQITKAYLAANYSWRTGQLARTAIYDDSNNLIANTDSGNITITSLGITNDLATWTQATISSGFTMVAGTTYRLAFNGNNTNIFVYYDSGGANIGSAYQAQTYSLFPSDPSPTSTWNTTNKWSICYEYTSAAAPIQSQVIWLN